MRQSSSCTIPSLLPLLLFEKHCSRIFCARLFYPLLLPKVIVPQIANFFNFIAKTGLVAAMLRAPLFPPGAMGSSLSPSRRPRPLMSAPGRVSGDVFSLDIAYFHAHLPRVGIRLRAGEDQHRIFFIVIKEDHEIHPGRDLHRADVITPHRLDT